MKAWTLTKPEFDQLLAWLEPDPDQRGAKYEDLRRRLIKVFVGRGYAAAEDLADETIDRVASKIHDLVNSYTGDPALYFYAVARNVHLEQTRKRPLSTEDLPQPLAQPATPDETESEARSEREQQCFKLCLKRLDRKNREFILLYYRVPEQGGPDQRIVLAEKFGMTPNALRIRVHRIKSGLQKCLGECCQEGSRMK